MKNEFSLGFPAPHGPVLWSMLVPGVAWHGQGETGAAERRVVDVDMAAMSPSDGGHDGEAQTGAAVGAGFVESSEPLENRSPVFRSDAGTVVIDHHLRLAVGG